VTLIEIPYWWDRKFNSLAVTIYTYRPDLFTEAPMGKAISLIEPSADLKKRREIQGKHSPFQIFTVDRLKDKIMTATLWEPSLDPTGWYFLTNNS
jgi:hypothetical protein